MFINIDLFCDKNGWIYDENMIYKWTNDCQINILNNLIQYKFIYNVPYKLRNENTMEMEMDIKNGKVNLTLVNSETHNYFCM